MRMRSRCSFSLILGDFWHHFRRSFSHILLIFPRVVSKRFRRCPQNMFYRFGVHFGCRFGIIFVGFRWLCENVICVTSLVRKLHFWGFSRSISQPFHRLCSEPVSGRRFERLFFNFSAILSTLGEAFWRLWAQLFGVTLQGVERWPRTGPPPLGDPRGKNPGDNQGSNFPSRTLP